MTNKPIRIIRGKDIVKWLRKPKELSNTPMGVKRGKERVSGSRKPKE